MILRIPLPEFITDRADALFGAGFLLFAPRPAERRVKAMFLQRHQQALRFQIRATGVCPHFERVRPFFNPFFMTLDNQRRADLFAKPIAEFIHFREFVARVNVHERKREFARIKGFLRQPNHHARIFADGIEHDRMLRFRDDFAHNMDGFGL